MTWIVFGAGGQLGSVLLRELAGRGEPVLGVASLTGPLPHVGPCERVDITDAGAVEALLSRERARYVIHAAAMSSVGAAHADPERARRVNADATGVLARLSEQAGSRFVFVSTDMVFNGERAPYSEADQPEPLSEYGRSKLSGEKTALVETSALVARLPLLYGPPAVTRASTFLAQLRAIRKRMPLSLFHDEYRTPLSLLDAARALIRCAESDRTGILHLAGPERLSRLDMGERFATALGIDAPNLLAAARADFDAPEPRPRDLSLDGTAYVTEFGEPAGRSMADALADALAALDLSAL